MENIGENTEIVNTDEEYYMWATAYSYLVGRNGDKNVAESVRLYQELINRGYEDAIFDYISQLYHGTYLPQDRQKAMSIANSFAEKGNPKAQEWMATILESDTFMDYANALEWRKKAAQQGYANALVNLGFMYEKGKGVKKDEELALKYYKELVDYGRDTSKTIIYAALHAAELCFMKKAYTSAIHYYSIAAVEDAEAQYQLGVFNLTGEYLPVNIGEAIKWLEKAAKQGHVEACACLGLCYNTDKYGYGDGEIATYWFEKAVEKGQYKVLHDLGNMYMNGEVIQKDINKAIQYYVKSAQLGDLQSQTWLAYLYRMGEEVQENPSVAFYWEKKAAENKKVSSLANVAQDYIAGYGVEQNVQLGINLLEEAAKKGDVIAQFNLGNEYRLGEHVACDYDKAFYWYEKAAAQGDGESLNILGWMYKEIRHDVSKAFECYLKAAQQGDAYAQFNLALEYKKGEAVEKDFFECEKWFREALKNGCEGVEYQLGILYELDYKLYDKAAYWYQIAIDKNDENKARAMCFLAVMMLERKIQNGNVETARKLLLDSMSLGFEMAEDIYKKIIQY